MQTPFNCTVVAVRILRLWLRDATHEAVPRTGARRLGSADAANDRVENGVADIDVDALLGRGEELSDCAGNLAKSGSEVELLTFGAGLCCTESLAAGELRDLVEKGITNVDA